MRVEIFMCDPKGRGGSRDAMRVVNLLIHGSRAMIADIGTYS